VLGTESVSVLEMAAAYSTLAARGVRVDGDSVTHGPAAILEVDTADGAVLYRSHPLRTSVLPPAQADVVNYCLRQVVERGTGTAARFGDPGQIAGKTGTTDDYGDAWFIGYTPKLTTAVWMGWADGSSRKMTDIRGRKVNGGSFPATMWKRFMSSATQGSDAGTFPDVTSFPGQRVRGVNAILPTTTTSSTSTTSTSTPTPAAAPPSSTPPSPRPVTSSPSSTAAPPTTAAPVTTTTTAAPRPTTSTTLLKPDSATPP